MVLWLPEAYLGSVAAGSGFRVWVERLSSVEYGCRGTDERCWDGRD